MIEKYIGQQVEIIYADKSGKISQRLIKVLSATNDQARCYCYTAHAPRTFASAGVLAVMPVRLVSKHG